MATVHDRSGFAPYAARQAASPHRDGSAFLAAVLGYILLLPPQLSVSVLGSSIPPYRFFLLAASLFVVFAAFKGRFRIVWADIAILFATLWICFAASMTSTPEEAFTASMAHIADIGLAYFFARAAITNLRQFRVFLLLIMPGLLLIGLIMVLEAVSHRHLLQPIFVAMTGNEIIYSSAPRLGLMRAQGPFAHPILAGLFLASFLPLYWLSGLALKPRLGGALAALASFVTVSSATFLALAAGIGLLIYHWLSERIVNLTWRLFFFGAGLFIFVAELGTQSGTFSLVLRFASLNSTSGYNRVLIWKFGSQNVINNPWFGIGYGDWVRPTYMGDSVDNYWLLTAMRFGLPVATLIALAVILAVFQVARRSMFLPTADKRAFQGVAIALSVFAIGLISVAVWLSVQVWFFVLIGIAVSLGSAPPTRYRRTAIREPARRIAPNA